MARKNTRTDESQDEFTRTTKGRKRLRKRYVLLFGTLLLMLLGLAVLPSLATSRAVLLPLIDRFAGIAPLRVDFQQVSAGWFSPVSVDGLQLIDGQGQVIANVKSIQTDKGLFAWIMSSQNLGSIRISDVDVAVVTDQGSTNFEQAIAPLVQASPATPPKSTTSKPQGTIELTNARVMLSKARSDERWLVAIPSFKTQLPDVNQVIGPTQLSATVGTAPDSRDMLSSMNSTPIQVDGAKTQFGSIVADVSEVVNDSGRTFNVRAVLEHVPLGFWQVLHERLPEIPIEQLSGSVSGRLAGSMIDADRWSFNVEQLSGDQVVVTAPQLIGDKPAQLQTVQFNGQATLSTGRLQFDGTKLATDFASVTAGGFVPWPIVMPTITSPWMPGAQFSAQGSLDLAKLVRVAESLVPMREDTRLLSGSAQFRAEQQLNAAGQPTSQLAVELGNLEAVASGQQIKWDQPFKLSVAAKPQANGEIALDGNCIAEFCNVTASGTPTSGLLNGVVDLDRLQNRLSQWVSLPVTTMKGNAEFAVRWAQGNSGLVESSGTVKTSPLVIAMSSGGELREPAWQGTFTAQANMANGQMQSINSGRLELNAQTEKLKLDLLEPLSLAAVVAGAPTPPPAAFVVSAEGSLELWKNRAVMLKLIDPSYVIGGNFTLGASGRLASDRMELQKANWTSQPFVVGTSTTKLTEPKLVGNFEGRVDTNDLTRLAVEKLVVQASSFALSAADAAAADGSGSRDGKGAFVADLKQLMNNTQMSSSAATSGLSLPGGQPDASAAQMLVTGEVRGDLAWRVSTTSATVDLQAKGTQIDVQSLTAGQAAQRLWNEPEIMADLKGEWIAATGNMNVERLQIQAPWMSYAGTVQLENKADQQIVRSKGQCLYDAALVAAKLQPYIGNQVQLVGRKTVPVEVVWTSSPANSTASMFANLQAMTRIGWTQARVVGIDVGEADVPINITSGQLATNAEIPVSGGKLRWDIVSDLTAPQLVINQKPMVVLENVAITPQMCESWLKYVTPLLAEATSVDGRLSVQVNEARLNPANPRDQTIDGQLLMHSATIGPGPLSNQVLTLVQQVNAIRKRELVSAAGSQKVWLQMPQQNIAFRMENGRVAHKNLSFKAGDVTIASSGSVDIDGRLNLATTMPVPDDWIEKSPWLAGFRGQSLQFPVSGTLTAPRVDTQLLGTLGQGVAQQAVQGALQQGLSRGLNKLFGAAPANSTQPAATPVLPPIIAPQPSGSP